MTNRKFHKYYGYNDVDKKSQSNKSYLFLHVPKTAGSAFRNVIKNCFHDTSAIENPYLSTQIYSTEQINWLFQTYPFRFYSGHVFRLSKALNACNGQLQLIAFVRDPIDKAISSYYYLKNRNMTASNHPVKLNSLSDLCMNAIRGGVVQGNGFDDSQLDWLVGEKYANMSIVKDAVASGKLLLFPTEQFDVAMVLLERMFPMDFANCAYASKVNTSTYDVNRNEKAERVAVKRLPWIEDDYSLHQLACESIDNLVKTNFISKERLYSVIKEFHVRCANVAKVNEKKNSKISKIRLSHKIKIYMKGWIPN